VVVWNRINETISVVRERVIDLIEKGISVVANAVRESRALRGATGEGVTP
jgi:hypothetical protein